MRFCVLLREDFHVARNYHGEGCDLLRTHGEVDIVTIRNGQEAEALHQFLSMMKASDGAVIGPWYRPAMQPEHWQQARRLKVFAGTFDNRFANWVDFGALASRGITLIDTSRSMTPSVAEFALAMTLNLIRDIPESMYLARAGEWKELPWNKPGFVHGDLTGRRVGLVGFGSINRRYAELLAPFRCSVRVYDPFVADDVFSQYGVECAESLIELAQSCEIFVVGLPPTPTTLEIISRDVILLLGAMIIHIVRGELDLNPTIWGKGATFFQIMAVIGILLQWPFSVIIWYLTLIFTGISGVDYIQKGVKILNNGNIPS